MEGQMCRLAEIVDLKKKYKVKIACFSPSARFNALLRVSIALEPAVMQKDEIMNVDVDWLISVRPIYSWTRLTALVHLAKQGGDVLNGLESILLILMS